MRARLRTSAVSSSPQLKLEVTKPQTATSVVTPKLKVEMKQEAV